MAVFIGVTLAFFANSDFATSLLGMSGKVKITAVGRGDTYQSIEDKDGISNMLIYLQDGYQVLIPGMEIDAQVNVKVHKSTTKPLLRAKLTVKLYDKNGEDLSAIEDSSNVAGDIENQLNDIIVSNSKWYKHLDNYYYYIGDNSLNSSVTETLLEEVDATNGDSYIHFIDSPIKFPSYVTSEYSSFGVKLIVTFQAIQNYIPDDYGYKVPNTIKNSLKIFSAIADAKLTTTPLECFDVKIVDGKRTISVKDGVTLPETVVLPTQDADGNAITNIDSSFANNKNIKKLVIPSTYTSIEDGAFMNSSIESVDLSNSSIETISENAFRNCSNLTEVNLPSELKVIDKWAFGISSITSLVLPNGLTTIKSQGIYLNKLSSIYIPASVTTIEAFPINCTTLKKIEVSSDNPNYKDFNKQMLMSKDGKSIITIIHLKNEDCNGELRIPNGVERLYSGFIQWAEVDKLYIPSSVTSIVGDSFLSNAKFREIIVDSGNTKYKSVDDNSLLVSIDGKHAYRYATLNTRTYYEIPEGLVDLHNAFNYIQYIKNIVVPSTATTLGGIGSQALDTIKIAEGNSVYTSDKDIAVYTKNGTALHVFVGGYSGGSYTVLDGVTTIKSYLSQFINYDIDFVLPSSVTTIESYAFGYKHIRSLEFKSVVPPSIATFVRVTTNIHKNLKIYVPDSAVNAYKAVAGLSMVKDRIYPVSQKS